MLALIAAAPAITVPDVNVGAELLRVILSLVGIIVLILAAGWFSRRLQGRTATGARRIRCMETFSLGAKERLLLIQVDGRSLLIGAGQGGMRTLHVYEGSDPVPVDAIAATAPPIPGVADLLARWRRAS